MKRLFASIILIVLAISSPAWATAPLLSSFAKQSQVMVNTATASINGGWVLISVGNAIIAPATSDGHDVCVYLADGVTIPTFTRFSYSVLPSSSEQLAVQLPPGTTGSGTNYTLKIGSCNAGAADQSTAFAKPGPILTGASANNALSWWNGTSSDTTSSMIDALDVTGDNPPAVSPNSFALINSPTRGASISGVAGTSVLGPGVSCTFNGTNQFAITNELMSNPYFETGKYIDFTIHMTAKIASFANNPNVLLSMTSLNGSTTYYIGVDSSGHLKAVSNFGVSVVGSTALSLNTVYDIMDVQSEFATKLYVNGVLYATGPPTWTQTNETVPYHNVLAANNTTATVQVITLNGSPSGGTFTASVNATGTISTTTGVAWNASASTFHAALVTAGLATGNFTITGSNGGPYTVTFQASLKNTPIPPITINQASLTGGTASSSQATVTDSTTFTAFTVDDAWISSESCTADDAMAQYVGNAPPIGITAKRKLTRIGSGTTLGLLIPTPGSGLGSSATFSQPSFIFNPGGFQTVAGRPFWIGLLTTQIAASNVICMETCSTKDPTNPANWTISQTQVIGGTGSLSGVIGTAQAPNLIYDPSQNLFVITYTPGGGASLQAVTTPSFAASSFSAPSTLLASTLTISSPVAGSGFTFNESTILPTYSSGGIQNGWENTISCEFTESATDVQANLVFTSPNLINGGTWTYDAAKSAANINATSALSATTQVGWPCGCSYAQHSYFLESTVLFDPTFAFQTQQYVQGLSTDATNFTTYGVLPDPVLQAGSPVEASNDFFVGITSSQSMVTDGSNTYVFFVGGNQVELATYPGTPDKLFATGTVGLSSGLPSGIHGIGHGIAPIQ